MIFRHDTITMITLYQAFIYFSFIIAFIDSCYRRDFWDSFFFCLSVLLLTWFIESTAIHVSHYYQYSWYFANQLLGVPFCVPAAWYLVIYTGITLSSLFEIPSYQKAIFVALWGLMIDFSLESIAQYLNFWTWHPPAWAISFSYFQTPVSNFISWFIFLFSFSFLYFSTTVQRFSRKMVLFISSIGAAIVILFSGLFAMIFEIERLFLTLQWWEIFLMIPLPTCVFFSLWLKHLRQKYDITLPLIPAGIIQTWQMVLLGFSVYIWSSSGNWYYFLSTIVATIPLITYAYYFQIKRPIPSP